MPLKKAFFPPDFISLLVYDNVINIMKGKRKETVR